MAAAPALNESPTDFYVYVHRRTTDGSVFYVGKGRGARATATASRNPHWHNIVKKNGFTAEIVANRLTEEEAFAREKALIASYGRERLCNRTDGGEGNSGRVLSPEHKRAWFEGSRRFHTGHKRPPEWVAKIAAANKGQIVTAEQRAAISAKLKGQKLSAETRAKMAAARTGHIKSPETLAKLRAAWTEERKAVLARDSVDRNSKAVICIDTGEQFASMSQAGLRLGKPEGFKQISRCCLGQRKTAYGYRWRYAD